MRKIGSLIFSAWVLFWIVLFLLLLFPIFLIIIQKKSWHRFAFYLYKFWSFFIYIALFSPVKSIWKFKFDKKQAYVFCPNHFSFLDIAIMTRTMKAFFVFVGMMELQKVPLFGYLYKKIHIGVDRSRARSRLESYNRAKQAIAEGKNLVTFPEGGIWTAEKDMPLLSPFKNGPFKIAIEMQVPLVPVTLPYNWKIMPIGSFHKAGIHRSKIIYHSPIETKGMTLKDVQTLKEKTRQVIDQELRAHFGTLMEAKEKEKQQAQN